MAASDIEPHAEVDSLRGIDSRLWRRFGRFAWHGIRLPVLMLLMIRRTGRAIRLVRRSVARDPGVVRSLNSRVPIRVFRSGWFSGFHSGCGALVILLNAVMRRLAR